MGRDIVALSRHNLDVSNIEALAKDISNRHYPKKCVS
jgi:hypothetical protein